MARTSCILIFIMLTHWNNNPRVDMSLRIILISSQRVFAVYLADKRSSKYQFNSLWFEPDRCSSPRSITLEASTLIITPPMQSWYWIYGTNEDISNASLICLSSFKLEIMIQNVYTFRLTFFTMNKKWKKICRIHEQGTNIRNEDRT